MAALALSTLCMWTLYALWTLTLTSAVQGQVFTPQQERDLDDLAATLMGCRRVPGLTMAVVKGNDTWRRGYGVADRDTGRNVTTSTLFAIGSVTKSFTAHILATLLDDSGGKYSWSTPLVDILGKDFQLANEELTRHITIKDILVHRTGLMTSNLPLFASLPASSTREDYVKRLRFLPVVSGFRDAFAYNNWMYTLAGRVAEVLGGASWEDLLLSRLLRPLNMTESRVFGYDTSVFANNFALPYVMVVDDVVLSEPEVYNIKPQEPAGAIASSADDMSKWLLMLVNDGRTPGGATIVNETRMREMLTLHLGIASEVAPRNFVRKPDFPVTFTTFGYGYAWLIGIYRGYQVKWHSGGVYAYVTYLVLLPDLDIGIFISTNGPGTGKATETAIQLILHTVDVLLGEEPWFNVTTACDFPRPWRNPAPTPPKDDIVIPGDIYKPETYAGDYGNMLFGEVYVERNVTGGLTVTYSRLTGRLFRTKVETVLMFEVLGSLRFLSAQVNMTSYMNFTFARPASDSKYQELHISAPDIGEPDVIVFKRGLKYSDPLDYGSANGQKSGTPFVSRGLLVTVILTLLFT